MFETIKTVLCAAAFALTAFAAVSAHEFKLGDLEIIHPHSVTTPKGAPVAGGWLKIINHGKTDDRLLKIECTCSDKIQIHEMTMENDVMKMRELKDGLPVPAGQTVELKKGGLHIMFMDLKEAFMEGDMIKAKLTFEKAGTVEVEFLVSSPKDDDKKAHDHSKMKG